MQAWIQANGGVLATAVLGFALLNILLSALQSVFNALKLQEPGWLQKFGSVAATATSWLSANVPTPQVPSSPSSPAAAVAATQSKPPQMSNH